MVFYFSGTGNSLAIAKCLSQALSEPLLSISTQRACGQSSIRLSPGEKVGLVFPVYFYTVLRMVADFIQDLRFTAAEKPYLFTVMICPEQAIQYGRTTLKKVRYVHPELCQREKAI